MQVLYFQFSASATKQYCFSQIKFFWGKKISIIFAALEDQRNKEASILPYMVSYIPFSPNLRLLFIPLIFLIMPKEPAPILRIRGIEKEESLSSSVLPQSAFWWEQHERKVSPLSQQPSSVVSLLDGDRKDDIIGQHSLLMPFSIYTQETTAFILKYQRKSKCSWETDDLK